MTPNKPDLTRPALIGGLIGFALTVVPPLCCLNLCCCLNFILAGGIAGALYARSAAPLGWYPGAGEGASTGALAGLVAGGLHGIVGGIGLFGFTLLRHAGRWGHYDGDFPFGRPEPWVLRLPPFALASTHLVTSVLTGIVAGLAGGAIAVSLFRVTPRAAVPGDPPFGGPSPFAGAPPASRPVDVTPPKDDDRTPPLGSDPGI